MTNPLKTLNLKKFRTKPISLKRIRIPSQAIDFIDEDLGVSSISFDNSLLCTVTLSYNKNNIFFIRSIIRKDSDDKSFMIATDNRDATRLYIDLSVQSNNRISIEKIKKSKSYLRNILIEEKIY